MGTEQTRERWLQLARDRVLRQVFTPLDLEPPDGFEIPVTCGWPSRGALAKVRRVLGQCTAPVLSDAGDRYEINVSPWLAEPADVLAVLVHELVHVIAGVSAGHKGRFVTVIRLVGLEGKPTATEPGEALRAVLAKVAAKLGAYPHARLNGQSKRKQGTRMLKVSCPDCGYVARITRVWIAVGLPTCPCSCRMTLDGEQVAAGRKGAAA